MNKEYITELANRLVADGEIAQIDLEVFVDMFNFDKVDEVFLPTTELSTGTLKKQRLARFKLAGYLWNKSDEFWLKQEQEWLDDQRSVNGSTKDDSKDEPADVIAVLLLTQIYAASYQVYLLNKNEDLESMNLFEAKVAFALLSLNQILRNAVLKGLARTTKVNGNNLYDTLRDEGVVIGCSGKFLPNPKASLVEVLSFFLPENINPDIYKK